MNQICLKYLTFIQMNQVLILTPTIDFLGVLGGGSSPEEHDGPLINVKENEAILFYKYQNQKK